MKTVAKALTREDTREYMHSMPIGALELFPINVMEQDVEATRERFRVSGARVLVSIRSARPADGYRVGDLITLEVVEAPRTVGLCRECDCTESEPCEGGCYWVEPDLCSGCAPRAHPGLKPGDERSRPGLVQVASSEEVARLARKSK